MYMSFKKDVIKEKRQRPDWKDKANGKNGWKSKNGKLGNGKSFPKRQNRRTSQSVADEPES